ncbi:MAG: 1-hydroxycarotenoid 3,4-desaturase CrtD [Bacteroidia bacterium]
MKIAVVGSGIAGLACAVRLAANKHDVYVFEKNEFPGGKLSEFNIDGFRFDAGPSLLATPFLIDELFELVQKNPRDYFNYKKTQINCVYHYADGTNLIAWHDKRTFANELKEKLNVDNPNIFFDFLKQAEFNYNLTAPLFIEQSLHKLKNYLNFKTLKGIFFAYKLHVFKTLNQLHKQKFNNPKLVQYFNRFATYNGSNPYKAPGLLHVIAHLEHYFGSYIPQKGMYSITNSIYNLAKDLGVKFYFKHQVNEIKYNYLKGKKQITGIVVNNNFIEFDAVLSNADIYFTYKNLLPNEQLPEKIISQEKSSSALIFYWGIKKQFNNLDLHNIFFSADYETEFDYIFNKKQVFADPTVYINITSKYVDGDAPQGCENWFVMINVPNNSGQNWDEIIKISRQNILNKLSNLLGEPIEPLIVCEHLLEPRSIESRTGSFAGALYGNASNNRYAAFLRHKNFSDNIKGLYFCGGSVHPGGGIPLCLNSAKIVSQLIKEDY